MENNSKVKGICYCQAKYRPLYLNEKPTTPQGKRSVFYMLQEMNWPDIELSSSK